MVERLTFWAIIALRVVMLTRFMSVNGWIVYIMGASEAWAILSALAGRISGVARSSHWSASLPAILYLTPLLLTKEGAMTPLLFIPFLAMGLSQCGLRFYMGAHVTVATPMWRGLLNSGPFGIVRHPLASLEMAMALTFVGAFPTAWNICIAMVCIGAGVGAALAEEAFLSHFKAYQDYSTKVPSRFIPGVI